MAVNIIDPRCHVGETHGIYTIVDVLDEKDKYGHYIYKCVCNECGFEKFSHYGKISGPKSVTTQCKHTRANGEYIPYGYKWTNDRIRNIFKTMIVRCNNPKSKDYKWYGAKGVYVDTCWTTNPASFEEWAITHGYKDDLTIDRIDSNGNYTPDNCQWIPAEENSRKAGKVNWVTVDGITLTGRQWSQRLGLGLMTIDRYIKKYGTQKVQELISRILIDPISNHHRNSRKTWFSVYNIQV